MSVSKKAKYIDDSDKDLCISRQCELLQLPRSSYYRPRYYQVEDEENLELMRLIDEEFLRYPFYGSRKMKVYLNRIGAAHLLISAHPLSDKMFKITNNPSLMKVKKSYLIKL